MTVAVTYAFQFIQNLNLTAGSANSIVDVTGLASGGIAAAFARSSDFSEVDIFNAGLGSVGGQATAGLLRPAIDQLSNGNIVVVSADSQNSGYLSILNDTNGQIVRNLDFFTTTGEAASIDVAALTGGGFVAVTGTGSGSTVAVRVCSNAGAELDYIPVASFSVFNPVVAALDDGGFAVAWEQRPGGHTSLYRAVYNGDGSLRGGIFGAAFDTSLSSVLGTMSITATGSGFAIAY